MTRFALAEINAMDEAGFVDAFGTAFELSPWLARRAYAARPFADRKALDAAMRAALRAAPPPDRLALIRAHPELAPAFRRSLTAESLREQSGAGLDRLDAEASRRFQALNAEYGRRFAFPFIICVRLNDVRSILAAMERRLGNEPEAELEEALAQIELICALRLDDRVDP